MTARTFTRRNVLGLAGASLLLTVAACAGDKPSPTPAPTGKDPDAATEVTSADDAKAAPYQGRTTDFALAMLNAAIGSGKGNAVISPLSVSQCLALVAQGASGATGQQFADVLGCADADELRRGANAEITAIAKLKKSQFDMANTAFVDDSFTIKPDYAKTVADWFGVAAHTADFANPQAATTQINGWVAGRTKNKIPDLLQPDQVTTDTRAVLVNALYLNAKWEDQFDPNKSSKGDFTLDDGTETTTKFMKDERVVRYARVDGITVLELPYEDDDLAALFVMPAAGVGLSKAISVMTSQRLDELAEKMQDVKAELSIPTFEARQRLGLKPTLQDLGITDAFEEDAADFSALADEPTYLSFVQHEAWLKVAEKGTEGAAATAGGVEAGAAPGDKPVEVRLDRPFMFAVRVRSSRSVAFIAAIEDPSDG